MREDTFIHLPTVLSARPDHAAFIREHFSAEVSAANYSLTENINEAHFLIRFDVSNNMIFYDDGTMDFAPPDEPQYLLKLSLVNNETSEEMLSFSYPFTELHELYDFSLTMVYAAMANVPITRLAGALDEDDRWRNQWIYVRFSLDYPVVTTHMLHPNENGYVIWNPTNPSGTLYQTIYHKITAVPGATLGVEVQFLDWMSAELGFIFRFGDPDASYTFIPGLDVQLKFPLKPSKHFMLEPYLSFNTVANTSQSHVRFPWAAVGGGFQFGVKGGATGAFFVDTGFTYHIGDVVTRNYTDWLPSEIHYTRFVVGVGVGYKIGFYDRPGYGLDPDH